MTPEAAAAVMAERESVLALLFVEKAKPTSQERAARLALDDLAAAIRARPAPVVEPAGDGWQPIETAPRDVASLLGFSLYGRFCIGEAFASRGDGKINALINPKTGKYRTCSAWRFLKPPALADLQRAEG